LSALDDEDAPHEGERDINHPAPKPYQVLK